MTVLVAAYVGQPAAVVSTPAADVSPQDPLTVDAHLQAPPAEDTGVVLAPPSSRLPELSPPAGTGPWAPPLLLQWRSCLLLYSQRHSPPTWNRWPLYWVQRGQCRLPSCLQHCAPPLQPKKMPLLVRPWAGSFHQCLR